MFYDDVKKQVVDCTGKGEANRNLQGGGIAASGASGIRAASREKLPGFWEKSPFSEVNGNLGVTIGKSGIRCFAL